MNNTSTQIIIAWHSKSILRTEDVERHLTRNTTGWLGFLSQSRYSLCCGSTFNWITAALFKPLNYSKLHLKIQLVITQNKLSITYYEDSKHVYWVTNSAGVRNSTNKRADVQQFGVNTLPSDFPLWFYVPRWSTIFIYFRQICAWLISLHISKCTATNYFLAFR